MVKTEQKLQQDLDTKGGIMDIKIEEVKIIYTYNPTQTSTAFDEIITCIQDNQISGDYKVVGYSNPIEYKITKEE